MMEVEEVEEVLLLGLRLTGYRPTVRQNPKHLNEAELFIVQPRSTYAPPRLHLKNQVARRQHNSPAAAYPVTPLDAHAVYATPIMRTALSPESTTGHLIRLMSDVCVDCANLL